MITNSLKKISPPMKNLPTTAVISALRKFNQHTVASLITMTVKTKNVSTKTLRKYVDAVLLSKIEKYAETYSNYNLTVIHY